MPNDIKAVVSAVVLLVAVALAYWDGSPIRPEYAHFVIGTAIFMIIAMWMFPEAGVKKGERR
jgi:glycerol uptake facilitator-like aquaporin